jgi:hypothetical protein
MAWPRSMNIQCICWCTIPAVLLKFDAIIREAVPFWRHLAGLWCDNVSIRCRLIVAQLRVVHHGCGGRAHCRCSAAQCGCGMAQCRCGVAQSRVLGRSCRLAVTRARVRIPTRYPREGSATELFSDDGMEKSLADVYGCKNV